MSDEIKIGFSMHPRWVGEGGLKGFVEPLCQAGLSALEFELDSRLDMWEEFEPLMETAVALGLDLSFHAPYRAPHSLAGFSGAQRSAIVEDCLPLLGIAENWGQRLGSLQTVVVHSAHARLPATRDGLVADTRAFLEWALDRFLHLLFALENNAPPKPGVVKAGDSRDAVLDVLAPLNDARLKICWDMGHDYLSHGPARPAPDWLARVGHVHVHDVDERGEDHFPLIFGRVPYKVLFFGVIEAPQFWGSVLNTFYFALGVPINLFVSLMIALLLNRKIHGVGIFRTAFFLPAITSVTAISVVWLWLYHPAQYGLFNSILIQLGLPIQCWLRDPLLAMLCLIAMGVWSGMGYNIIIFLAGLQSIPRTLYKAAEIDGAGRGALFRQITFPLLGPTVFYILTVGIINSLKAFTEIDVMTQGGPLGATTTMSYLLYQIAFQFFQMGRASAVAVLLFVMLLVLTWVQFRYVDRRMFYE